MKNIILTIVALISISSSLAIAGSRELPPKNAKPLSEILASIQNQKSGYIAEIEFDRGRWEITVCEPKICKKLSFNPLTGLEEGRRNTDFKRAPTTDSTPITTIVRKIEATKIGSITEIEFDKDHWEVKLAIP